MRCVREVFPFLVPLISLIPPSPQISSMSSTVIVYGGRGALGASIVSQFKKDNFNVVCIDVHPNEEADINVAVDVNASWTEQETSILKGLSSVGKVSGVFCVAGGWAGGKASDRDMIKNADLMWKQSVYSSTIAARIASVHLVEGGILQLTGASAALDGTPGMIGYGMAKGAVHQLTKSLSQEGSGLPTGSTVLALLPVTLDTPMNRKFMPDADFSTWTPLEFIAGKLLEWTKTASSRPKNGGLVEVKTKGGETTLQIQ